MPFQNPTGDPKMPVFYNVEKAVGNSSPNEREDVRMVQYMIKNLYRQAASDLVVDGWIGPITVQWIRKFQTKVKSLGGAILVDSRVDRALGSQGSVSKTPYTILYLNAYLKQGNPAAFAALPSVIKLKPASQVGSPYNPAKVVPKDRMPRLDFESPYISF